MPPEPEPGAGPPLRGAEPGAQWLRRLLNLRLRGRGAREPELSQALYPDGEQAFRKRFPRLGTQQRPAVCIRAFSRKSSAAVTGGSSARVRSASGRLRRSRNLYQEQGRPVRTQSRWGGEGGSFIVNRSLRSILCPVCVTPRRPPCPPPY